MLTIHKVNFGPDGTLQLPLGALRVLLVAQQDRALPTVWYEVDTELAGLGRRLVVVGTGHDVPSLAYFNGEGYEPTRDVEHLGSAVCGPFVWHVYGDRTLAVWR